LKRIGCSGPVQQAATGNQFAVRSVCGRRIGHRIEISQAIDPVHEAQLLTYMKLLEAPKGILINFHCYNLFKNGQKTFVNHFFRSLPD